MLLGAAGFHAGDWVTFNSQVAREAAEIGLTVLNLRVNDPETGRDIDVTRVKRIFADNGLVVGQTNGNYGGGLVSSDEAERARAIKFVKRMCNLTRKLGSPNTYLRPGSMNRRGAWLPHPENRSQKVFDRLVDSARQICKVAENEGVKVAVEGGVVSPLYSARSVRDFIDAVGSRALGFNQDPVNFVGSIEDAYDTTRLVNEFFDLLGNVTLGAHTKDFKLVDALLPHFEEEEIGSGMLDHVTFLRRMQQACPNGHVLIEHLPKDRFAPAFVTVIEISKKAGIVWDKPAAIQRP
jgi:sugar phosphate isomerase/epimerase